MLSNKVFELFKEGANIDVVSDSELMELTLFRYSSQGDSTLGLLFKGKNDPKFLCFTIEDEYRAQKVMGETRIPEGTYEIKLRKTGGFHERYTGKYPDIHKGMLHLQDVPDFEYVLMHIGNNDDETEGCILVGNSAFENVTEDGQVGSSTAAYKRIYLPIAEFLENGGIVELTIHDFA